MDDGVLLHVHMEQPVHGKLPELPQDAHGHGEAKGRHGTVDRGEVKLDAAVAVENVNHGKADGRRQKAAGGVEHGVPIGVGEIVALELPENFRGEDKEQDDDFQGVGEVNVEPALDEGRQHEEHQRQQAGEGAFVVAPDDVVYQQGAHDKPQGKIQDQHRFGAVGGEFLQPLSSLAHLVSSSLVRLCRAA